MKKLYFFEVAAELEDNFFGSGGGNEMVMTKDFIWIGKGWQEKDRWNFFITENAP